MSTQSWHERLWRNNNTADIARGFVPNSRPFSAFGERATVGAVTRNILWETGLPDTITVPNGIQLSFVSTGTDTRRFKILYLDGDLESAVEIVTLNGTTPVLTTATDIRFVNLVYSLDGFADRTVTGTNAAVTYAIIGPGQVQSNGAVFRVPISKRLMLTSMYAGSTSATADARVTLKIETSFFNGDRFANTSVLHPVMGVGLQDTTATLTFDPFPIPGGEIAAMTFKSDKAVDVVGGFFGWLENAA